MRREDFFTGEVLSGTSPQISEISTEEAINNASFGKYDYEPGARVMQPISINPGGYGYNNFNQNFMNPHAYNGGFYQQPNMGYNPYYNQYQQMNTGGYNPYYNGYYQHPNMEYNPYYNNYYNNQYQQQMQQEVRTFIEPVNLSGSEYLPPSNYEDQIEQMKLDQWLREQEEIGRVSMNNNSIYSGYNYYGAPFYNPFQYNSYNSEIANRVEEMKQQARENRINLNIQLSMLAHNYLRETYDENELRERYTGKYVTNPGTPITYAEIYEQQRFNNLVPFDNSQMYRDHYAAVSKEHNEIISSDSNLKDCFANMGVLNAHYLLEEEKHRRRNGKLLYNSDDNSYKYFVRARATERYAKERGLNSVADQFNFNDTRQSLINQFPTLSQSAKLCDDGTLNITCNFGSKAGQVYSVHNSQEASYDQDRERFQQFIDSIPGSIYLDSPIST
jgi:hypothetical protein